MKNTVLNRRKGFIIIFIAFMLFVIGKMYSTSPGLVNHGKADLSGLDFKQDHVVELSGHWEFYWGRLLAPEDFKPGHLLQVASYMKVPGTWDNQGARAETYPANGVATYRLRLNLPPALEDPAVHIQHVADAYNLYADGRLIAAVGKVSDKASEFQDDEKSLILDLPKDAKELELIFQVANLKYAGGGGLRQSLVFGSKHVLEQRRTILFVLQLFFIGSIFIFAVYYFLLFLLQAKNKTALFFSMLCFITVLRSLIWA